ncbi:MAG TPA: hypothetical protein VK183_12915 [Flavobacterium sp.]|nr:hypothetical protein [Flavobacterium sp.]
METLWEDNRKGSYDCFVDGIHRVGVVFSGSKGVITTADGVFEIRIKGFWRTRYSITDQNGTETELKAAKGWGSGATLKWKGSDYQLKIRNNPLVEGAFWRDGHPVLAYGLTTENRKAAIRVTRTAAVDPLLEGILFYIMRPIFQEQGACDVSASLIMMMSV